MAPAGSVDGFGAVRRYLAMAMTFAEAQAAVAALPRQDRARLFVWMAAEMADQPPGLEFDPEGRAR